MANGIRRLGVLTGGGDCPGLNAVIRVVTKAAILEEQIEVFGVADGYLGLIENRIQPLSFDDVSNILDRGGTILGTSNRADPARFCTGHDAHGKPIFEDVTEQVLANVQAQQLDGLICIGGDGTMSGAARLAARGLPIIGIPKTIDNDLMGTDVTFGFDTAVAIATDALMRIRTTASSHHRVMLVELMGRNAGWITLHAGTASGADVILIPEVPFTLEAVGRCCRERSRHGRAYTIVAVSEGAKPRGGEVVVDRVVHESPDPVRLGGVSEVLCDQIAELTKLETRATILGHVQRGGTPTARDRVLATEFAYQAIELMRAGQWNRMAALQHGKLTSVPLESVADRQRTVPLDDHLLAAARAVGTSLGAED